MYFKRENQEKISKNDITQISLNVLKAVCEYDFKDMIIGRMSEN